MDGVVRLRGSLAVLGGLVPGLAGGGFPGPLDPFQLVGNRGGLFLAAGGVAGDLDWVVADDPAAARAVVEADLPDPEVVAHVLAAALPGQRSRGLLAGLAHLHAGDAAAAGAGEAGEAGPGGETGAAAVTTRPSRQDRRPSLTCSITVVSAVLPGQTQQRTGMPSR
ncbi:hypothetical protein ABT187_46860, partial [Streptomyces sp. NPDC001817]|uniref:hypothetical protein n=1 Tax=Streptomyces sp. NPDC001817 TaxID=3154398 RepID=UPI003327B8CF